MAQTEDTWNSIWLGVWNLITHVEANGREKDRKFIFEIH